MAKMKPNVCSLVVSLRQASWLGCGLAAVAIAAAQITPTEIVLHNFQAPPNGLYLYGRVATDSAGNLYGTADLGGKANKGVVFKLDSSGHETVLFNFTGGTGSQPRAGVALDSAGNLYGTTMAGGTANKGVVFKLDTTGHETVLHSFAGGADGSAPLAGVAFDTAGNLYGTTLKGGTPQYGVVYKIDTTGHETILHSFQGGSDGSNPAAEVVLDSAGNIYGTTQNGGVASAGTVYKVDTAGHETVLYSFSGMSDGGFPAAGLVLDSAGNLYGTAIQGGKLPNGGVIFKLDPTGHETVLHNFTGGSDGFRPKAGMVFDSTGNLYGTTSGGGKGNAGIVYKVDTAGHETVMYSFTGGADGGEPVADVILDSAGNLYGTTSSGGASHAGVVFRLDQAGHEMVLASFTGGDGYYPSSGLAHDSAGNLYGTTSSGGLANQGTVYKLNATGHETVLYSFTGGADGAYPTGGVVLDTAGNLYGTTANGGASSAGVLYLLDTSGHETVLFSFTGGADGGNPGAVVLDPFGNLCGTTAVGGASNMGVVYKVDASGHETVLHSFTGTDGSRPVAGVTLDSAGNLYGTASGGGLFGEGVVYKIDVAGQFTLLYTFQGGSDGGNPYSSLMVDSVGSLYGTTYVGGTGYLGDVYKVDASGNESVLYNFTGGADGREPEAGVIRDSAGNLYGTTLTGGGTSSSGVVFKLDTTGHETILHSFTGGADGKYPSGGVILDSGGNLYGATEGGGKVNLGVVFELKP